MLEPQTIFDEERIYAVRKQHNIQASFKSVDTCAAEFEAFTPYYNFTYG